MQKHTIIKNQSAHIDKFLYNKEFFRLFFNLFLPIV